MDGEIAKNTNHISITNKSLNPEVILIDTCYTDSSSVSSNMQIPNSLLIHSDLSEPFDIKNCFSSYAYESPALDTEEKVSIDSEGLNHSDDEIPSPSCLLTKPSDLSEPPDITNWFSSYVYESPVLDTEEELKLSVFGKDEIKTVLDSEKQNLIGTEDNCLVRKHPATKISDDESHELKLKESNDHASRKEDRDSLQTGGDIVKKIHSTVSSSPKGLLERKDHNNSTKGKYGGKETDYISRADSQRTPLESPVSWSTGEVNKRNDPSTNGFISTKNKYINENGLSCSNNSQRNHTDDVRKTVLNFPLNETYVGVGRRPLLERTNLQYEVEHTETTGKWRCPQRSKPDLGPPLKQLRLEKWVRRVQ